MNYVYVPFMDKSMDSFAPELVRIKNEHNKVFGRHKLIARDSFGKPLQTVGWNDRLYVLVHGSGTHSGVGVNTQRSGDDRFVEGEAFAKLLVDRGLKNSMIDVRLWTCWGGKSGSDTWTNPGGVTKDSFAFKVAKGFRALGYTSITVVGYTRLVNLSNMNLAAHGGHKVLQDHDDDNPNFSRVTSAERVKYKVASL